MFDRSRSGCYAKNHGHKDRPESLLQIYNRTWELFDELHDEAPDLFIDCTFETMGALQAIDFDMCKHAEGNWLSNFEEPVPEGSQRVRQMAWWRGNVIPATALVIGNQTMDDPSWELSLKSLIGSLPIMLGDPRKVSSDDKLKMKKWAEWMRDKQNSYDYLMYRHDLPGFGEPRENFWDGWSRINTKSQKGGIVGVFRNGGFESERTVRVDGLNKNQVYEIRRAPNEDKIDQLTGKELKEKGFTVKINDLYNGAVFSIESK